jgi:hypothetical protein
MRAAQHPLGCLVKLADNLDNTDQLGRLAEADPERARRLDEKYARAREVLIPATGAHLIDARPPLGIGVMFGPPVRADEPIAP